MRISHTFVVETLIDATMPRVSSTRAKASGDKLSRCLEALVQNPDAACVGGGELCCSGGGCSGGGSELVSSVAAFLSHGDAAKRAFVRSGGLEVIQIILSKTEGPPSSTDPTSMPDDDDVDGFYGQGDEVSAQSAHA